MLAIYALSLAVSAGLAGVFIRQVLASVGFISGFQTGLLLVGGTACLYLALQLAYMALVKVLEPTRSKGPYITEALSHAASLVFLPYLLHTEIQWPHPAIESAEPLVYAAVFLAIHCIFKLMTFYAALLGEEGGRLAAVGWMAASALGVYGAYTGITHWIDETEKSRPRTSEAPTAYRIGDVYAMARPLAEGAVVQVPMAPFEGQLVTLRWAPVPMDQSSPVGADRIFVTVDMKGSESKTYAGSAVLLSDGWRETRIPSRFIPNDVRTCSVRWTRRAEPNWQRMLKIRPVAYGDPGESPARVLFSGPFYHQSRPETKDLNIVLVTVDGLAASHVSFLGYERSTTPNLDRMAAGSTRFRWAFTPAPDPVGAYMSLLTGTGPMVHGYVSTRHTGGNTSTETLAEVLGADHYVTAAFTEGEAEPENLDFASGIERGFELFDAGYEPSRLDDENPTGSAATLRRTKRWIQKRKGQKFFVFARLRELTNPGPPERYAPGFLPDEGEPKTVDLYDSAIASLDKEIRSLLTFIRDQGLRKTTCIVVTAPFGLESDRGAAADPMSDPMLRVPLIILAPRTSTVMRNDLVSLEDLGVTLAALAGTAFSSSVDGHDLFAAHTDRRVISVTGDPLVVSLRSKQWRYTWETGIGLFSGDRPAPGSRGALYRVSSGKGTWWRNDLASSNAGLAQRYREEIRGFVMRYNRPHESTGS